MADTPAKKKKPKGPPIINIGSNPGSTTGSKTGEGSFVDTRDDAIEFLKHALGQVSAPSVWGGSSPAGFDCSGLVEYAAKWAGLNAPRTSQEQAKWATPLKLGAQLQPGDLIFEKGSAPGDPNQNIVNGHVVIYLGQGLVLAADESGAVHVRSFNPATEPVTGYGQMPGMTWDPSTSGASTFVKDITRYAAEVRATGGPVTTPVTGLPTAASLKPKPTVITVNQLYGPNAAALANASQTKDYSAYETVQQELDRWGLSELAPFAYKAAMGGQNAEQIAADIRRSPQYNAAFPGMAERVKEGLPPLSEDAYITYENSMLGIANKYSLPRGFITKTEIGKLVAQNVSPVEFSQRMDALSGVAIRADPLVRREFDKFFGVKNGLGALTAYFADPNRATDLLTQQASAAQLAAQSGESGLGALDKTHAMRLTQLEYTEHLAPGTVRSAIDTASNWNYLRAGAPGSVAPKVSTGELIGAEVPGYNGSVATNRSAVKSAESARESFLESGGGYEATPRGAVGVGGASTEGRGGV